MTVDFAKMQEVFLAAVERRRPEERDAYLDHACGSDEELRRQVNLLLKAHHEAGSVGGATDEEDETRAYQATESAGTVIGPYKLLQQIGEGGMGTVYMAEQSQPVQRKVAIKLIKPGMNSRHVIARFEAERQALAVMDHPNVAKVLDAGTTESGRPYFVMELVKGVPITKYCDEHRLTLKQRLELFIPICQAVQHAHQKGIIHRDLKPSNVLVCLYDGKPVPKVIDFGLAKATGQRLTEHTMFTEFGQVVGTLEYMSPEQAELNQLDIDTRSDIYSLGVILYELLTGTTPLERRRVKEAAILELLRIIREEEPPTPSTRLSTSEGLPSIAANRGLEPKKLSGLVRGELDWIVMKCLDKDRTRRYETANGLARDVERYLADEAVEACPPSATYRLRKFARKNRKLIGVTAAFAVLLSIGTIISTWQAVRATKAEGKALTERDRALTAEERATNEAAISKAVNDFFNALLAHANPSTTPDPNLKLQVVLDEAAKRIEGKFADQPMVEARLRGTLADTYNSIGLFPDAERHVLRARQLYMNNVGGEHPGTLQITNRLGYILENEGRYPEAQRLHEETLAIARRVLGPEHPLTLASIHNLASVHFRQGRREEARRIDEEVLAIRRRVLGPEHPDTLKSMNNLALVYNVQGRLDDARKMFDEVLAIERRVLGPEHPLTLTSWQNLADVYQEQGRFDEARKMLEQILAIRRRVLRPGHPDTLGSMNNLASVYQDLGRLDEARKILEEIQPLKRRVFGPEHPSTLGSMNSLAIVLHDQARFDEARKVLEEVLAIERRVLGSEHPNTLSSWHNLAMVHYAQGRFDEARKTDEEILAIRRRVLGSGHPDTLKSMSNLGAVYLAQGKPDEARKLFEEALAIERRVLGPEHPDTLRSMHNLATVYQDLGRLDEARKMLEEVLPLKRRVFGPEHSVTLMSMNNLASVYRNQGSPEESLKLHGDVLAIRRRVLGTEHPDTLSSMHNLAVDYYDGGRFEEARALNGEVLAIRRRVLGSGHPDTLKSMSGMGAVYLEQGKPDEARRLFEETVAIERRVLGPEHPDTLMSIVNLATVYLQQGKTDEARKLLEETVAIERRVLGPEHPDTLKSMHNLAKVYKDLGRFDEARKLNEEALATRRRALGPNHPSTLESMNAVASCYLAAGKYTEAVKLLRQVAERWENSKRTDADSLYNAACFRAELAAALRGADKSSAAAKEADTEADRAMAWLAKAVAAGFTDFTHIKTDEDLKALHGREDYKKLVAELESKAKKKPQKN
jgi:serine/threonine protein kinase/tetratricopeptide (TPR) repeat protein